MRIDTVETIGPMASGVTRSEMKDAAVIPLARATGYE